MTDVIDDIRSGMHDNELTDIMQAVHNRQRRMGRDMYDILEVGDRVMIRLDAPIKPKYILGATGEVVEKRVSKVTVRFDDDIEDPYGKWAGKRGVMEPGHLVMLEMPA